MIVLCGGLATRLRPITEKIPKSLVDVNGRPFIEFVLERLSRRGIRNVVLSVGYLGEMLEQAVGSGERFGLSVRYSYDGPTLLGTAGAIKGAAHLLTSPFFVQYGDSFLDVDYTAVDAAYQRSGKLGLMTVLRNEGKWDRSNVVFRDGRLVSYDKRDPGPGANYIDYGLSLLDKSVLERVPEGESCDLSVILGELSAENELEGFEVFNRFYEIGTITGLTETREYLKLQKEN
ncbi:MAG TPA: sugar phosphate nucleotidyltransferase [Spirochaetia bacterium]|nr:sugar phosphate nucleotidyltransferase [Spirochaetia bacterium]